jgi:hypothetical protein
VEWPAPPAQPTSPPRRTTARWGQEFNAPDIAVEDIICDGCLTRDGRLCGYCLRCDIRPCGMARGVANCAHCDEYVCHKLERLLGICDEQAGFFGFARHARTTLDDIHARLAV